MSKVSTRFRDLTGQTFGKLTVKEMASHDNKNGYKWLCVCECGNETIVSTCNLTTGHTKSCGCLFRQQVRNCHYEHGQTYNRIYQTWCNMKARCYNKNVDSYKHYGGKGIKVCDEWKNSFETFFEWACQNGYDDTLTIDRIDVNKDYEPSNCRWADKYQQANNKSSNSLLTYNGKTLTMAEWAQEVGISAKNLRRRKKLGWSAERILTTPVGADKWHKRAELMN